MATDLNSHFGICRHGLPTLSIYAVPAGAALPQTKAALFARGGPVSPSVRSLENSFAPRRHWQVESPWGVKGRRCRLKRWNRFRSRPVSRIEPRTSQSTHPSRSFRRDSRCFQHAPSRCCFFARLFTGGLPVPILGSVVLASATSWFVI